MRTVSTASIVQKAVKASSTRQIAASRTSGKVVGVSKTTKVSNAKIGSNMDFSRFRFHKTPTPVTDGAQKAFTIPDSESYVAGLLEVFLDGLMQIKDTDYVETSATVFTMTNAPDTDEVLRINYIRT
jgi:hypothetical protein